MQIRLRDVPLGKPSISEMKTILISWTACFSVTRQMFTLVVTWTKRICACGLRLSLMSISITHLVRTKWLFGARWVVIALSGHTGSSMLMDIRELWTHRDILQWEENSSQHWSGGEEWFISRLEQHRIAPVLHSNTSTVSSWRQAHLPLYGPPLACTFFRPMPLFSVGIPKDRVCCASNPKLLMCSKIMFERVSGEIPMKCWTGSLQTSKCEVSAKEVGSSTTTTTILFFCP